MTITDGLKPYFKTAAVLGVLAMLFDTWLSGKFGWTIDAVMAGIFALVSLASGVLLVIAAAFWRSGDKNLARGIAAAWVPIFAFNVLSNMGVATANRMTDVQEAAFQQAKVAGIQKVSSTNEADVKRWQEHLKNLNWAPNITAEMARAQLQEKTEAAERESRRGGCGPRCEAIKREIVELQRQIGAIEERANLNKQIAATKAVIEKKQAELATADAGISQAANQAGFFAKLIRANLYAKPDGEDVAVANEGMGMFTALVLALVSALLTYIGAYPHLTQINPAQPTTGFTRGRAPEATPTTPGRDTHTREIIQPIKVDDTRWKQIEAALKSHPATAGHFA